MKKKNLFWIICLIGGLMGCSNPSQQAPSQPTTSSTEENTKKLFAQLAESKRIQQEDELYYAIIGNNEAIKQKILQSDLDPSVGLRIAAVGNDLPLAKAFLAKGADVNAEKGKILAGVIVSQKNEEDKLEMVNWLLDIGADPNLQPYLGKAARSNYLKIAQSLIDSGAKVNDTPGGSTALITAVEVERPEMVQFLLDQGANPDSKGKPDSIFNEPFNETEMDLSNDPGIREDIRQILDKY